MASVTTGEQEVKQSRSEVWAARSASASEKLFEYSGLNNEGIEALKEYVDCKVGVAVDEMWMKGKTMIVSLQRDVATLRAENAELRGVILKLSADRNSQTEGCSTSTTSGTSPPGSKVESEMGTPETHCPGLSAPELSCTAPNGLTSHDFSTACHGQQAHQGPTPPSPLSELPTGLGFGGAPGLPPISPPMAAQIPMPPLSPALLSPFHFGAAAQAAAAAAVVAAQQQQQQQQQHHHQQHQQQQQQKQHQQPHHQQHPALHMPQASSPFCDNTVGFGGASTTPLGGASIHQALPRLSLAQALGDCLPKLPKTSSAAAEECAAVAAAKKKETPQTSGPQTNPLFTVSLRKVDTDLGLGVRHCPEDDCLTVEEICPGGAAEAWNLVEASQGSGRLIQQGDSILSINGVSLSPAKMLEECSRSDTLTLLIRREDGLESEGAFGSQASGLRADASVFVPRTTPTKGAGI